MTVLISEESLEIGGEFEVHSDRVRADLMIIASASLDEFDGSFGDEPVDEDGDGVNEASRVIYDPEGVDPATDAGAVRAALKQLVDSLATTTIFGVDWTWVLSLGGDTSTATPGRIISSTVIYDTSSADGQGRWMISTEGDKRCLLNAEILYHELSHIRLGHGFGDLETEEREARAEEGRLNRALGRPVRSVEDGRAGVGCEGDGPCCIVATVASGGPYAPAVGRLRRVRDHMLRGSVLGEAWFAELHREYYAFSVPLARAIVRDRRVSAAIAASFVEPLVDALELAVAWAAGGGDAELGRAIAARGARLAARDWPALEAALAALRDGAPDALARAPLDAATRAAVEPVLVWIPRSPHVRWAIVELLLAWGAVAAGARGGDAPAALGRAWSAAMTAWIERMPLDAALGSTGASTPGERRERVRELLEPALRGPAARAAAERVAARAAA
jgi:hypothetical protein